MAGSTTSSECCFISRCDSLTYFEEPAWQEVREGLIILRDGIERGVIYIGKFFEYAKQATGSIEGWKKLSGIIIPLTELILKKELESILGPLETLAAQFDSFKNLQSGFAWVSVGDDAFKKKWNKETNRIIQNFHDRKYVHVARDCLGNLKRLGVAVTNCMKLILFGGKLFEGKIGEFAKEMGNSSIMPIILSVSTIFGLMGNGLTLWINYDDDKKVNDKRNRFDGEEPFTEEEINGLKDRLRGLIDKKEASNSRSSKSKIDLSFIPLFEEKAGNISDKEIAQHLWLNSKTLISEGMVQKVNQVSGYLIEQGFELRGIKADGNCFLKAYLKSYETLSKKIPILENQKNKVAYLREIIAAQFQTTQNGIEKSNRAQEIMMDREWLQADNEGVLLAKVLKIPIRVITCNQSQEGNEISDMLFYPEKDKDAEEWNTIDELEQQDEYIVIVDLGGHFVCAQSLSLRKNEGVTSSKHEEKASQISDEEELEYFADFSYEELRKEIAFKKAEIKLAKVSEDLEEKRELIRQKNSTAGGMGTEELKEERIKLMSSCNKITTKFLACKANVDALSTITPDDFKEYKIYQYQDRLANLEEHRTKVWIDVACNVLSLVVHGLGLGKTYYGVKAIMSFFDVEELLINNVISSVKLLTGFSELGKFFYDENHKDREQMSIAGFTLLNAA